jgi:hypothetical protein
MGSINSRSSAPAVQPYAPVVTALTPAPSANVAPVKTEGEIATEARTENLLRRSRGRLGTILTGFRGFLDSNKDQSTKRKTLLGE